MSLLFHKDFIILSIYHVVILSMPFTNLFKNKKALLKKTPWHFLLLFELNYGRQSLGARQHFSTACSLEDCTRCSLTMLFYWRVVHQCVDSTNCFLGYSEVHRMLVLGENRIKCDRQSFFIPWALNQQHGCWFLNVYGGEPFVSFLAKPLLRLLLLAWSTWYGPYNCTVFLSCYTYRWND